jgi:hypothetical protein
MDIWGSVSGDTAAKMGLDPNEGDYAVNAPVLESLTSYFSDPEADSENGPDIWQYFGPDQIPSVMSTFEQFGYDMGSNPKASDWVNRQRVNFAKFWQDPEAKNRAGNLLLQAFFEGQRRRQAGEEKTGQPFPTPTPTPTPSLDDEIRKHQEEVDRLRNQGY